MFKGKLSNLPSGVLDSDFKQALSKVKLDKSNPTEYLNSVCEALLSLKSKYGGKPEGFVFKTSSGTLLKVQQDYQLDRAKRDEKKALFQGTPEQEKEYINNVNSLAKELAIKTLNSLSEKEMYIDDLKVHKLSTLISNTKLKFTHPKKTGKENCNKKSVPAGP